tara:strand:+ start:26602 stop:27147 length:546 start_codon:yes stop_codon:yes gene_type:complete
MVCVEKQLVLNRVGENSLNDDTVEIIKEFAFKSRMRVDAEKKINRLNTEIKFMVRNNYDCWPKWSVTIHTRDEKKVKSPRNIEAGEDRGWAAHRGWVTKKMGSIMCGYCGNYRAWLEHAINPPHDHVWVPYRMTPFKCAPRARCKCNMGDFWESDVDIVDNEVHTWPPQEGSFAYFQIYES